MTLEKNSSHESENQAQERTDNWENNIDEKQRSKNKIDAQVQWDIDALKDQMSADALIDEKNNISQINTNSNAVDTIMEDTSSFDPFHSSVSHFSALLPEKMLHACQNPNKPHEHILWWVVWLGESCVDGVQIIWQWLMDTLKFPRDVYLVLSGQAQVDIFQDV